MIRAKDIQRIIAANETAQEASIEIKTMVDNYIERQFKKCNLQSVNKGEADLLIAFARKWNNCSDPLIEDEFIYNYLEGNLQLVTT